MANYITQALLRTGIISPTTRVIFNQGLPYGQFLARNGIEDRAASLMTYSILRAANVNFPNPPGNAVPDSQVVTLQATIDSVTDQGSVWFVDLVSCHQVSALSESNVTNYFASKGADVMPWKILDVIGYLSSIVPKFAELDEFNGILDRSTFVAYHTSASSSASLLMRAVEAAPFDGIFTDEEIAAADDSITNFHSIGAAQRIPSRALVMTSVILQSLDVLPSNWYMGKKAVSAYSPAKYATLISIMKKAIRIATNIDNLDSASDLQTIQTMWASVNP